MRDLGIGSRKPLIPDWGSRRTLFALALGSCMVAMGWGTPSVSFPRRLDRANLLAYRAEDGTARPVRSIEDWRKRREEIVRGMLAVMGPIPDSSKRVPLDVAIEEEHDAGSYLRRRITFQSEPGSRAQAYLLIPKSALSGGQSAPGVVCLMSTDNQRGNKQTVGIFEGRPSRAYAAELAEQGYVAIAPAYPLLADYQPDIVALGYRSGTMKAIWDNMRALDLLESLPYVRRGGFGAIGHSLGGHNAIFTAVLDERIRVIVSSCGFDSYLDYYGGSDDVWQPGKGWAQRRYMPQLLNYARSEIPFDFHELLGALAPRPVYVNAPVNDSNFKWQSVDRIAAAAGQIYRLYDVPNLLRVDHPDCAHDFPDEQREIAYRWLDRVLR
ncbi:MAG: hypothetical protein K1X42_05115 [Opitutaceae bacterium]|nr:hypothetical protein [Opitutaceae bacterium]